MSNINVRVVGTANVTQMTSAFAKVQGQVAALNAQMAQMVQLQNGVDAKGYERMTKAAAQNSKYFRNAAASTGMFEVQQLKLNRATDDYIQKLTKQQMSFRELAKQRKVAAAAYKEQLAMENMVVRKHPGGSVHGKDMLDVTYPKEVSAELNTAGKRLAFFNEQLKSGAHQMVNWGKNTQWAGRQLMVGFTMPMAAFGAAAGVMAYQVDKQLTRIAKVYDTNADLMSDNINEVKAAEKELADLREQATQTAIEAARSYGVAATDTLEVQAELAAVGMKGAELQESTNQVMRIATLGEIDQAVATKALISLQATLGATTEDTAKAFDFMNSVENATSLATADFAAAIPRALGPMKEMSREGASAQEVLENLSVLMVAMKERGIEAGEGANAVKALMSRVYRPSKQVRSEWEAMGLGDPATFAKQGKDIMDILGMVGDAVRDLKGNERTQALAGLFGTYQVARMNAMLKGLDNVNKEGSQVARTFDVMGEGAEKWAETATQEVETYAESLAGRFDRAKEEMKIQLATLGEPFVEVATVVINGVSKIIDWFNKLPKGVKIAIAAVAGFAAISGPVVMLTGLLANLSGQALKGIAHIVSLGAKMNILPKDARAAQLAAEMVTSGFIKERDAVEALTAELKELAAAQAEANRLSREGAAQRAGITGADVGGVVGDDDGQLALFGTTDVDNSEKIKDNLEKADDASDGVAKKSGKTRAALTGAGVATAGMASGMLLTAVSSNKVVDTVGQILMMSSMMLPMFSGLSMAWKSTAVSTAASAAKAKVTAAYTARAGAGAAGMARGSIAALGAAAKLVPVIGWVVTALSIGGMVLWKWHKHMEEIRRDQELQQRSQERSQANIIDLTKRWADETGRAYKNYVAYNAEGEKDYTNKEKMAYDKKVEEFKADETKVTVDGKSKTVRTVDAFNDMSPSAQDFAVYNMGQQALLEMGMNLDEAKEHLKAFLDATGRGTYEAENQAERIFNTIGNSVDELDWDLLLDTGMEAMANSANNPEMADQIAQNLGRMTAIAFDKADTQTEKREILDGVSEEVMGSWESQRKKMYDFFKSNGGVEKVLSDSGFTLTPEQREKMIATWRDALSSTEAFRTAAFSGDIEAYSSKGGSYLTQMEKDFEKVTKGVAEGTEETERWERQMFGAFGKVFGFADGVDTMNDALSQTIIELSTMDKAARSNAFFERGGILDQAFNNALFEGEVTDEQLTNIKAYLEAGVDLTRLSPQGREFLETWERVYGIDFPGIGKDVADVRKEAEKAAGNYEMVFKVKKDELLNMKQEAWANLQEEMADVYREDLDNSHEVQMDQRQKYWDDRQEALSEEMDRKSEALDAQHDRQTKAMDARHERQTEALENKWENRMDAAEKYWDRRVDRVESAIEAEEKAEAKRKKMFDAEMARINKLNEAANRNIDFNLALSEGRFDEAAKIRNDAEAGAVSTALERAAAAGTARSERRVERMGGRLEEIEEAREKHMKILEDRAEAERKALAKSQQREEEALKKSQENQKKHLERVTKMRTEALRDQADTDIEALKEEQEREKKSLDRQMEMFLAHTARNKKELKAHMKRVGLSYDDFGDTLRKKGNSWAKFFRENLYDHIRAATIKIRSDRMWTKLGKDSRDGILKGMGFNSWKDFNTFVRTGVMPKGGGKSGGGGKRGGVNGTSSQGSNSWSDARRGGVPETRHEGGEIGTGGGSRKGVARNLLGLHSSETMVRAQKGEFMVNRDAAQRNRDILHRINSGEDVGDTGKQHGTPRYGKGGPGYGLRGPSGMMGGVMGQMLAAGLKAGVQKVYNDAQAKHAAAAALYSAGKGGMFSDRSFNAEQLKNAAIIANVGSGMGMSARDIMIGIMTAITESGLVNVNYGDRDSVGLFQQRTSQGWGSIEQIMNPEYAARKFFEGLRGISNRSEMSPWLAAQAVQRSFDPTGYNYKQYWDNAQAIYKKGLVKDKHGNFDPMSYAAGSGGWHKPTPYGTFGGSTHDIGVPQGTPVFAVGNGKVIESRYITSGGSPGNGSIAPNGLPYRSYGEMIKLQTSGGVVTYGHLAPGSRVPAGTVVKGGAQIARSGNTGNSSGPHLHLDINGSYIARSWLASRGISLKKGAQNINYDGVPAVLHKNEAVLTEDLNSEFKEGVSNFSNPISLMEQMMQRAIIPSFRRATGQDRGRGRRGGSNGGGNFGNVGDTGAKATINIGTLNTKNGVSAANTQKDLARLIPKTDFLALTEMARKFNQVKAWLAKRNWGLLGGRSHDEKRAALAYNKRTQKLNRAGTHLLGKKRGNFVGGREDRYANYGLFTDRKTGRKTWQVSAHTVPTPRMDARHRELFNEQWGNLDKLVRNLKGSGAPVFVSGDLNNNPNRDWWRKPGGLKQFRGKGVDWIFSDPRYAKAVSSGFMGGMHTDHGGAVLAGYKIPQLNVGAQNIKWDNTIANLHKGEAVLTEDINKKFRQGVDNFANGGKNEYNIKVMVNGSNATADEIAQKVMTTLQRQERRKPQSRRA